MKLEDFGRSHSHAICATPEVYRHLDSSRRSAWMSLGASGSTLAQEVRAAAAVRGSQAVLQHRTGGKSKRPETILDFVASFAAEDLDSLYGDPFAVLIIFRSLPSLARNYVLRLVPLGSSSIKLSMIDQWRRPSHSHPEGHGHGGPHHAHKSSSAHIHGLAHTGQSSAEKADKEAAAQHAYALQRLRELHILEPVRTLKLGAAAAAVKPAPSTSAVGAAVASAASAAASEATSFRLHAAFRECLLRTLSAAEDLEAHTHVVAGGAAAGSPDAPSSASSASSSSSSSPSAPARVSWPAHVPDGYGADRWARMLHFVAGVTLPGLLPPRTLQERLNELGLTRGRARGDDEQVATRLGPVFIPVPTYIPTEAGVRFLLKPTKEQVWEVVTLLVERVAARGHPRDQVLRFLFKLSFLDVVSAARSAYRAERYARGERETMRRER